MSKYNFNKIIPSVEEIKERHDKFQAFFEKYENIVDDEDNLFDFDSVENEDDDKEMCDLPEAEVSDEDSSSSDESNNETASCKALMPYKSREERYSDIVEFFGKEFVDNLERAQRKRNAEVANLGLSLFKKKKNYEKYNENTMKTKDFEASSRNFVRAAEETFGATNLSTAGFKQPSNPTVHFGAPFPNINASIYSPQDFRNPFPPNFDGTMPLYHFPPNMTFNSSSHPFQQMHNTSQQQMIRVREVFYDYYTASGGNDVTRQYNPNNTGALPFTPIQAVNYHPQEQQTFHNYPNHSNIEQGNRFNEKSRNQPDVDKIRKKENSKSNDDESKSLKHIQKELPVAETKSKLIDKNEKSRHNSKSKKKHHKEKNKHRDGRILDLESIKESDDVRKQEVYDKLPKHNQTDKNRLVKKDEIVVTEVQKTAKPEDKKQFIQKTSEPSESRQAKNLVNADKKESRDKSSKSSQSKTNSKNKDSKIMSETVKAEANKKSFDVRKEIIHDDKNKSKDHKAMNEGQEGLGYFRNKDKTTKNAENSKTGRSKHVDVKKEANRDKKILPQPSKTSAEVRKEAKCVDKKESSSRNNQSKDVNNKKLEVIEKPPMNKETKCQQKENNLPMSYSDCVKLSTTRVLRRRKQVETEPAVKEVEPIKTSNNVLSKFQNIIDSDTSDDDVLEIKKNPSKGKPRKPIVQQGRDIPKTIKESEKSNNQCNEVKPKTGEKAVPKISEYVSNSTKFIVRPATIDDDDTSTDDDDELFRNLYIKFTEHVKIKDEEMRQKRLLREQQQQKSQK